MSSQFKPITVYGEGGPNPAKVAFLLSELNLPYETKTIAFDQVKKPEYLAVNPNGRIPAIHDPNTNLTLWESGAIIEYLIERYDKDHHLSFEPGTAESYLCKQWLFFQTTGQGPYFGQGVWFKKFHHEAQPSALERYVKEMNRVTGVLEGHLAQQKEGGDGPWLVGGKLSYADIAFVPWQRIIATMFEKDEYDVDKFPQVKAWLGKMLERGSAKKVFDSAGK